MISQKVATVYYAPKKKRRYFTLNAAISAEAGAIISAKYPSERGESQDGMITDSGFHWREMKRSDVMHRRMCRIILKAYNKENRRGK